MADCIRSRTHRLWAHVAVAVALLLVPRVSVADEGQAATATEAMAEARKQFQAGVNLLDDPDGARYEEAYHAFHKAYGLSKSPKVLGNIGFCSLKLERDGEAIDAYTAYLRESPDVEPRERAQIERDLATLSSTVGTLRVIVRKPPGTYVVADVRLQTRGSSVANAYGFQGTELTLRLRPGRHTLKVKTNDAESLPWDVTIEPNTQSSHEFTFDPPPRVTPAETPPASGPSYAAPILLGVVGVAGLGAGAVTGFVARSKEEDLSTHCPGSVCPKGFDLATTRSEAKTFAMITDVSLIGGGVLLGTAIIWALALPSRSKSTRTGSIGWSPTCNGRGCAVQLRGDF